MLRTLKNQLFIAFCVIILSCSGDEDIAPPPPPDTCENLSLGVTSAMPFDTIYLDNVPSSFQSNTSVTFWANDQNTGAFMSLEETPDERFFIIAPIHPVDPFSDGMIEVRLENNTADFTCDPLTLNISALPEAPDYTQSVAEALQALFDQRLDFLDIDRNRLTGDLADLNDTEAPLAIVYQLLNNPASDISLLQFISNDHLLSPNDLTKEESLDLSNRILNRFKFLEFIQDDINSFDNRISFIQDHSVIKNDCGLDAAQVAKEMRISADAEKYLRNDTPEGMRFQETSDGVLASGVIPGIGTAAALTGMSLFVYRKMYEGLFNVYISDFTRIRYIIDKSELIEETACDNIPYTDVEVWVSNKGWSLDKSIWESIVQLAGLAASRLNWGTKIESITFDASVAFSSKQFDNLSSQGYVDGNKFKVDQKECGPIDVSDPEYVYGKIVSGDAFTVDQDAMALVPQRAGQVTVEVGIRSLVFGGNTISENTELAIKQIQLGWEPTSIFRVTPGDEFDARVQLFNAFRKDLKIEAEEGATQYQGFEDIGVPNAGIQKYRVFTPTDESKYPYSIIATHESEMCLRGKPDAQPRITILTIDAGISVEVFSLEIGCLSTGEQRDFDANVTGENKNVTWSAFNESGGIENISSSGLFTAPNTPGIYFIVATAEADNSARDTLSVEVGQCTCNWDATLGSEVLAGDDANFSRVTLPENVFMQFLDESDLTEVVTLQFPKSGIPSDGGSSQITLMQDDENWLFNGQRGIVSYIAPSPTDGSGNPEPGPTGVSIDLTLNGTTLEGRITGTVLRLEVIGQDVQQNIVSIDMRFNAEELDPSRNLWGCD